MSAVAQRTRSSKSGKTPKAPPPQSSRLARPDPAEVEREIARREAARQRLIPFCQYLWEGFVTRPYRELIAAALELLEARTITRLMLFAPQQFGKSELFSRN